MVLPQQEVTLLGLNSAAGEHFMAEKSVSEAAGAFDAPAEARRLVRQARRAALATIDAESGAPYVSLVAVATAADGAPLLLLSTLARHTTNLAADPRASLLFEDVGAENPLADPRVSVSGPVAATQDTEARRRYLARHPGHKGFSSFKDFSFYRLEPESAHIVAGFGRIETLSRSAVMTDVSEAADLLAAEEGATDHMNADHADALQLYATRLLGAPEGAWRCDGFDPEGMELSFEGRALYLRFPSPLRGAPALRQTLVKLAEQARAA